MTITITLTDVDIHKLSEVVDMIYNKFPNLYNELPDKANFTFVIDGKKWVASGIKIDTN